MSNQHFVDRLVTDVLSVASYTRGCDVLQPYQAVPASAKPRFDYRTWTDFADG